MSLGARIGRGRLAEVYEWDGSNALKLFYDSVPRSVIEREERTSRLVHDTGIKAPAVKGIVTILGRQGIVFERVRGPSMLTELTRKPWKVTHLAHAMADLHGDIHARSARDLPSQHEQLNRSISNAKALSTKQREVALEVLRRLPEGEALCHGDYHPDNIIMAAGGAVVLDWTTASKGNALADVACTSLLLRLGELPPGTGFLTRLMVGVGRRLFHASYLWSYLRGRRVTHHQVAAWMLPVAAARLNAGIAEETQQLLGIVDSLCAHLNAT